MKHLPILIAFQIFAMTAKSQIPYDSITISKFLIVEESYGANWRDTLKSGHFPNWLSQEKTIWTKPKIVYKVLPQIISIAGRVKTNGTADVSNCFIPRHSVNYYKGGKITKYLLICFECDGLRFSDDPKNSFVKSVSTREKQMAELKEIFKDHIDLPIR